jgi:hypothetical protein
MNLSEIFTEVAYKKLVAVDLPNEGSNQHELNGVGALKDFFGTTSETRGKLIWRYFADDEEPKKDVDDFTFYDARAKSAARTGRSEWRFYYYGNFLRSAGVDDWFFLARARTGKLFGLVFQKDSAWLRAAQALFSVHESGASFDEIGSEMLATKDLELLRLQILEELGFEVVLPPKETDAEIMVKKFGRVFPTTKELSSYARTQCESDPNRPDETLLRWLEKEEQLFRALENIIIRERLDQQFKTVEDFIQYSLSVQNRRQSRMGFALQNHLAEIFSFHRLQFTAQGKTEGNNRPDFIFPVEKEYQSASYDASLLIMLGAKSTSKDRWRQVLDEADRIKNKHLCTLEPAISTKQTDAMQHRNLTLVVPEKLHETYTPTQRRQIWTLEKFIDFVRSKHARPRHTSR